jgi:hypothetical protein
VTAKSTPGRRQVWLCRRLCRLTKIGICVGAGLEAAARSQVRRAMECGTGPREVEHSILLATVGPDAAIFTVCHAPHKAGDADDRRASERSAAPWPHQGGGGVTDPGACVGSRFLIGTARDRFERFATNSRSEQVWQAQI